MSVFTTNNGVRKRTNAIFRKHYDIVCVLLLYFYYGMLVFFVNNVTNASNIVVAEIVKILIKLPLVGDVLDNFPDSPGPPMRLSGEDASRLLDADDSAMDSATATRGCAGEQSGGVKRQLSESPSTASRAMPAADRPSLPPIYNSILRRKLAKNSIRHLDGSVINDNPGTPLGAAVSPFGSIGCFANKGDKRHNLTVHRHNHATLRNISTSFDPNTLHCKACQGGHQVLRRMIEGSDVGLDNPPLFVLADQNFPPIVPVGGEGECIKIVQVENGSLAELVEVFLGLTRGFDLPAGTVLLLSSASHAAFVGTADYAADFIRAAGQLRNAFMGGGVMVLHGIPFLIGGTVNTPAIRTMAEVEHWVHITANCTDNISATRKAFMASVRSDRTVHATQHIIRLPVSQTSTEKGTFVTTGFDNLKTAVEPINEEDEKSLLVLLIEELNDLYPLNLAADIICDRFMDGEVFEENMTDRTALILIGASHLGNIARHINHERWNIIDLTRPGWRVTSENVSDLVAEVTATAANINMDNARVILQLLDNSVYMVRGPGGETRLPCKDRQGRYHVDGSLVVADKATVRDLLTTAGPVIRALGNAQKVFLTPLARYWVSPCCSDTAHVTNYHTVGYLPKLGEAV